jgi:predicted deacylase
MLRILKQLPSALIGRSADGLADALGGPSLIRIDGERPQPVFVSVLLHGNETTGWEAVRQLLDRHANRSLPRCLDLFIGNVHAARCHRRRLDGQPDYNRVWKGAKGPEGEMASQLLAQVRVRRPIFALDVHNTSGRNPLYACCHRKAPDHLDLARSFSDTVVYVERPDTLLGVALSSIAPTITMECGRPGVAETEQRVADFIEGLLAADGPIQDPGPGGPLLGCAATVRVPEDCSFGFADDGAALQLVPDLDRYNFQLMPAGTPIARLRPGAGGRLEVADACGRDAT